jgi:predicted methyltransferase
MRKLLAAAGAALFIGACAGGAVPGIMMAAPAPSADIDAALSDVRRPASDAERDALRHPREILTFTGVQPGWRVADIGPGGGYYTRLFSVAVGPEGRVFAIDRPNAIGRTRPILEVAPLYPNVTVVQQGYQGWTLDEPLDAIFISQIYHDFHIGSLNIDVPRLNREMFAALKPGGVLVIVDHAAAEVTAAGFVLEEESQVLRNPADNRTERVFESDIRGRTDQFVLRFRKPA